MNTEKPVMVSLTSLTMSKDLEDNKYTQLLWGIRAGYPRLTVFTEKSRVRDDSKPFDYNSMIISPFDYTTIESLFNIAEEIIKSDKNTSKQIACYNTKYTNGERTNEIILQATVEVGKDSDGVIYMAVLADGKKRIKFEITPKDNGKWHKYFVNGEQVTDKAILSVIHAKAYFAQARRLMAHYAILDTTKNKSIDKKVLTLAETKTTNTVDTSSIKDDDLF